jgi:hypothetical protein
LNGEVTYQEKFPFALWQTEIDQGIILPCIAVAVSDVELTGLSLKNNNN